MRRMMLAVAIATLPLPALAEEFTLKSPLVSTSSVGVPFSAKETFGQPVVPALDSFPVEHREQNVEFEMRGGANGTLPGVTFSATRSAFPTPAPLFRR